MAFHVTAKVACGNTKTAAYIACSNPPGLIDRRLYATQYIQRTRICSFIDTLRHKHGYITRHDYDYRIDTMCHDFVTVRFSIGLFPNYGLYQGLNQPLVGRIAKNTARSVIGMLQDELKPADVLGSEHRRMHIYIIKANIYELCRGMYLERVSIARRYHEQMAVVIWETVAIDPLQTRTGKYVDQFEEGVAMLL